jgi:hypothetical protein
MAPPAQAILDPRARLEHDSHVGLAPRVRPLRGASLGLLNNAKPNAAVILQHLGRLLQDRHGVSQVTMVSKASFALPAEETLMTELAERCDFVIAGVGDCGSCSAGTVADGVLLERRGVPAAAICTDTFLLSGAAMARLQGFPDYPFVAIAHPIASRSATELEASAHTALAQVVAILEGAR